MKLGKIFIRFDEVAKYSDGTLRMVIRLLEKKLNQEKIINPKKSERDLILKALNTVENRIQKRNAI